MKLKIHLTQILAQFRAQFRAQFKVAPALMGFAVAGLIGAGSLLATASSANELDTEEGIVNEQALRAKDLPQTIVVRVNEATGDAAVLNLSARLAPTESNASLVINNHADDFRAVPASGVSELDRDSSASSWYVWYDYSYWYAPTYYYWGYTYAYRHYYSSYWGGYSYYWYAWYR